MAQFAKFPEQQVLWYWAAHFDSEAWFGRKATPGAAIEDAVADLFNGELADPDAEGFWLVSGKLKLPEVPQLLDEVIHWVVGKIEDDECWYDDVGIDPQDIFAERDQPEGLRTHLTAALRDWMVRHVDLTAGRMVDDFLTMQYYRKVENGDGTCSAELEADKVA